ncbi:MAG TPA: class I SAM-dependent methyltransferase family protein [Marmoricola sp.]|nr:class I SAM-dependent methyltransferase family protein [Marmoricola sp.]
MSRDWHAWHRQYDDPTSSLSRRLQVVRDQLTAVLTEHPEVRRLVSLCAGDGRDVLPVLATVAPSVEAVLVELDPHLAVAAEEMAAALGLPAVVVRNDDAGNTESLRGAVPADLVMACGVFGNVTDEHVRRTVNTLPMLLSDQGFVVWTRGAKVPGDPTLAAGDPSESVRRAFAGTGFDEVAFVRPDDASFRVGVHRLARPAEAFVPDVQMFRFL